MQRPSAAVFLLAGLIAADVVLVTGAVRSTHVDTAALARQMASSAAATTSSPAPTDTTSSTPSANTAPPQTGKVTVAALSRTRAWRAASPSTTCTKNGAAATIGHTEDGGKHWTTVKVPLTTVAGVSYADGRVVATGTNSSCKPATYAVSSTATPRTTTTTATWTIAPSDSTTLLASGKAVGKRPCRSGLLDVAANSDTDVVVLCQDHSVQHSSDGGNSWDREKGRSGVLAIATDDDHTVYAATRSSCGIVVAPLSADKATNCVADTKDWSGPVDATIIGGTLWLTGTDQAVTEPVTDLG